MKHSFAWSVSVVVCATPFLLSLAPAIDAQEPAQSSCDQFLLRAREVKGRSVGPTSCQMLESTLMYQGQSFRRVDIGLDGTVEGYVAKTGAYKEYLTNAPELVFPQAGNPGPIFFGVANYEKSKGAAMTVIYPSDKSAWNGKMFVTVHGRGRAFKDGSLKTWNKNLNPSDPLADVNKYDKLWLSKGYVLVKTYRTSTEGLGEIKTTLEDGTVVDYAAFNDNARYIMDFSDVAKNMIIQRLGQAPRLTYIYGHSAGARITHDLNYSPALNVGRDGKRYFDGILADDTAAGTWLPVLMKDGKDVLFATEAEKAPFVPMLDITHQMYNAIWDQKTMPAYMSSSFLENKRKNAKILRDKGLSPAKERMYEIVSISHMGGESPPQGVGVENLDLSRMMDRFIDILDAWVDKDVNPPATHSDWTELGDVNGDGVIENPALLFPEVACPLGVYFPWPASGAGDISFAAFTGQGLEPLDAKKVFVDMNRNGVWDFRETPTAAWQRLGLLQKNETLTREKYVSCVQKVAEQLYREGFFSQNTAAWYLDQARKEDLQPKMDRR